MDIENIEGQFSILVKLDVKNSGDKDTIGEVLNTIRSHIKHKKIQFTGIEKEKVTYLSVLVCFSPSTPKQRKG